jgi:hypothetical protein
MMSNEEVKATPEKSKWFHGKYRVTPETSKLSQPVKKEFKEGYWYKCITSFGDLEVGRYYKVLKCKRNLLVEGGGDFYRPSYLFDINSELPYGPAFQLGSHPSIADSNTMAKGEVVTRTIKVSEQMLTLSNEAADWLKGLMQNPVNGCLPEDEDERSRAIREAIFNSLKWMHETDEPISDEGMSWIG